MPTELIELTRKMREAQKAVDKSDTYIRRNEAQRLERLVDAELAKLPKVEVNIVEQIKLL